MGGGDGSAQCYHPNSLYPCSGAKTCHTFRMCCCHAEPVPAERPFKALNTFCHGEWHVGANHIL